MITGDDHLLPGAPHVILAPWLVQEALPPLGVLQDQPLAALQGGAPRVAIKGGAARGETTVNIKTEIEIIKLVVAMF